MFAIGATAPPAENEIAKLAPESGAAQDKFGYAVALSGTTLVAGARDDGEKAPGAGAAYVFEPKGAALGQAAKIFASDAAASDSFGGAVAIGGDAIVVGAYLADGGAALVDSGAAYVFERAGGWRQTVRLAASGPASYDHFGNAVAIGASTILIGSPNDDASGSNCGAVFVFERAGGVWLEQARLLASDGAPLAQLGFAVALDGDVAVAGTFAGRAAHVFERAGSQWSEVARLEPGSLGTANDRFGRSVAVSGATIAVGADGDSASGSDSGAVYLFEKSAAGWSRAAKVKAADGADGDSFGRALAVWGGRLVVGAHGHDGAGFHAGSAYLFERFPGGAWDEVERLSASDAAPDALLGFSVAIGEQAAVAGAYGANVYGANSGAAYLYALGAAPLEPWLEDFGVSSGWSSADHPRFLADVDGDGLDDIVGFGDSGVRVALSSGTAFRSASLWLRDFGREQGWSTQRHPRFVADLNRDGKADLLGFGNKGVLTALSTGFAFAEPKLAVADFGAAKGWEVERHPRLAADATGDGFADIVGFGDRGALVAVGQGDGRFAPPVMWVRQFGSATGWSSDRHPRLSGDVDGDGRADLLGFGDRGAIAALSNGVGFGPALFGSGDFGYAQGWRVGVHPRLLADVNGDGRADIVGFGNSGVLVARALGAGRFAAPALWSARFGAADGWRSDRHERVARDFDGDGMADIVGFGDWGVYVSSSLGDRFDEPMLYARHFGFEQGWRPGEHPRLLGHIDSDNWLDIAGFHDAGVFVY